MEKGDGRRYVEYIPLREAERTRSQGKERESEQDKISILTPDQINALLDKTDDKKYEMLFKLAIFSGARQVELLGLKWSDVDWKNKQLKFRT